MDRPVFQADFVETAAYAKARAKLDDPDVNVIVLAGPAGSGKTSVAMEMMAKFWPHHQNPKDVTLIFRQFNCSKLEKFYSDLTLFYKDLEKSQVKLSPDRDRKWEILQYFFEDMNSFYPDHVKLFILDDAEDIEPILNMMNHLCTVIKMNSQWKRYWKLVVTSQKHAAYSTVYENIGADNFIDVSGLEFDDIKQLFRVTNLESLDLRKIIDAIGSLPLTLKICMKHLKDNQTDNITLYVQTLLHDIEAQTNALVQSGRNNPEDSALISIKISIERLIAELPHPNESMEVIKTLTQFHESNIPAELIVACAETFMEDATQAVVVMKNLTSRLIERGICTKREESKVTIFSLNRLVKQSMILFVRDDDRLRLIEHALVAMTRVMPKDDRQHRARLVGFYGEHGKNMDGVIKALKYRVNKEQTPFIMFLHCNLLISMGYCLFKRGIDYNEGIQRLKEARDKYCELVLEQDYASLLPLRERDTPMDPALVERNIAKRLFNASSNLNMLDSLSYRQHIKDLPLYHRLTRKDLENMFEDPSGLVLINDHLTRDQLEMLERKEKVIDSDILGKVYIAEVLAHIFSVWSKVHSKRADNEATVNECLVQAEAAVEVYTKIFDTYEVYLLAGLITEREMLATKGQQAKTSHEVQIIKGQLEVLSNVGKDVKKRNAYEAGLARSNLEKDSYHKLLCLESTMNCHGRLFDLTKKLDEYDRGARLLPQIEELANKQVHPYSALSYSYKNYANFLFTCKKYDEAVRYILTAMMQLNKALSNGDTAASHPEFTHPRFKSLYSSLKKYYDMFYDERDVLYEGRPIQSEDKLLTVDMVECLYLNDAMTVWRDICNSRGDNISISDSGQGQPRDADNLNYLEMIQENEIKDLDMAENMVSLG